MSARIAVVGDSTDHNGRITSGSSTHKIGGKPVARLHDLVDCPQRYPDGRPHGINKIIEGHPTIKVGGIPVALHGDRTECGCTLATTNTKREVLRILTCITLLTSLSGCSKDDEVNPADVQGYNYTEDYIDQFRITGEEENFSSSGPNIFPKKAGQERSGGGKAMCCIGIPAHWRPGMKLIVKWRRDTHPYDSNDRTGDQWLTATTIVPPYGSKTYGFWVHFLPGDRIRVQIRDTPTDLLRPAESDPYIVQGVLDSELNKKRIAE